MGARICCIEKKDIGGTCLNKGCIPTKYLIVCVDKLRKAKGLVDMGPALEGKLVWKKMLTGKNRVVATQAKGIEGLFKSWGVTLLRGHASFSDRTTLLVNGEGKSPQEVKAQRVIIATGSSPMSIPGVECDGASVLNSDHIFDLEEPPESLLIIGAGAIGCEFACLFQELGCQVTIVEMMPRPLPLEDEEISGIFTRELKKKQIALYTGFKVASLQKRNGRVWVRLDDGTEIGAHKALVVTGRRKNTAGLGLERIGLTDIQVNEMMETETTGIYAAGDVVGKKMLAHVASREGVVAMENALGNPMGMDYRVVPSTIFTDPEIASVGLTEEQARKERGNVIIGRFPFRALGKAHVLGEIAGEVKIVAGGQNEEILGAHIIGCLLYTSDAADE